MKRYSEKLEQIRLQFEIEDLTRALRETVVCNTGEEDLKYAEACLTAYDKYGNLVEIDSVDLILKRRLYD